MTDELTKKDVVAGLTERLNTQLQEIQQAIDSVNESIKGEEKSSAGDKYETARAMNHIELDRLNALYQNVMKNGGLLNAISLKEKHDFVHLGSLVQTSKRNLFFCGGMGKLILGNNEVLTMSMGSPIGQVFLGKREGDTVVFNNTNEIIMSIQ